MPLLAILLATLLTASPASPAKACYTSDDIAKVFDYTKDDIVYMFTKYDANHNKIVYAQYYDVKSKLFFFFPIDAKGCLHPENVVVVTQYDYLTFTGIPYI